MKVKVYKGGYLPERAHFDDAGIDMFTPETFTLAPHGGSKVVDLLVGVQIPIGFFGKLESKSGLNVKNNIQTTGGVIDSGFRGTIKVRVTNNGDKPYTFGAGDKITQMVLIPVGLDDIVEVDELDPSESGRDASGWGSTGKRGRNG